MSPFFGARFGQLLPKGERCWEMPCPGKSVQECQRMRGIGSFLTLDYHERDEERPFLLKSSPN